MSGFLSHVDRHVHFCEGSDMDTQPEPPPEGRLIDGARVRAGISVREAARRAGISNTRWTQIVRGYPGTRRPRRSR